jgi:ketosteroid isomerase-like protein
VDIDRPELAAKRLEIMLEAGDLDGIVELYENGAVFAELGATATGSAEIRSAHQRFLDAGLALTLGDTVVLESGDIALVHWSWTVLRADGSTMNGVSAEVLRRQADGTWKFVIDNSDGSALVGAS